MNRRVSIDDHDQFQADTRQRIAATNGGPDPADVVEEIAAEALERCGQRRGKRDAGRVLRILDELNREGPIR